MENFGSQLHAGVQYCIRCCMPETEEETSFDELGICQACQNSEQKMHIDWDERQVQLVKLLDEAKAQAGDNYDCIVPISGGKDSTFQVYVLTRVLGMNPLAVTFNHNWYSETGWYNLLNTIETFGIDHIMYTPNRNLVNRLAKRSLEQIGDTCWHCHMGVSSFPIHIASKFNIPLLVYGESVAETGRSSYFKPKPFDLDYFIKVSCKKVSDEMANKEISKKELCMFKMPSVEECEKVGLKTIHLGDYMFWDDERQMEFVRDNFGWRETEIEGSYKGYKSAECIMPGMHDFTCYLKRGYGRSTTQASVDIRNGLLSREEGLRLVKEFDPIRPEALDYFLEISGLTEEEFFQIMQGHKLPQLKNVVLPVFEKTNVNKETILPFARQIVEKNYKKTESVVFNADHNSEIKIQNKKVLPSNIFLNISLGNLVTKMLNLEISPVDLAESCINRVNELEPDIKAWEIFEPDNLLNQAKASEDRLRKGMSCRLLEGIPFGIKDCINTKDFKTQMGSVLWKNFTPGNDARVVHNLREQGVLVPGKTAIAEFAVHELGKTINPHDPSKTPGTSSSGSAAAVATGMVPAALGTQTASSCIRPASFCGIYGFKPSYGLIPRTGVLKTTDTLDSLGFFTLWLEDLKRIFDVVRVKGQNYPISDKALNDIGRQAKSTNQIWKIALVRTHTWELAPEYAKKSLIEWARSLDESKRIEIIETNLPQCMQQSHEIQQLIYSKCLSYYFKDEYENSKLMSPVMNELIRLGLTIDSDQYHKALGAQERIVQEMDSFMTQYDAMICLSTAGEAPPRERNETPDPGLMWTLSHLPAMSAPVFQSINGLPFGAQLVCRKYNDYLLLNFAQFLADNGLIPKVAGGL